MKKVFYQITVLFISLLLVQTACSSSQAGRDTLYQTSTLNALMEGVYDGTLTLRELKQHGDFGLGTFDSLDGEMIILDGEIYQIKSDGKVYRPDNSVETPFAAITYFNPDQTLNVDTVTDVDGISKFLDSKLETANIFYAIKIDGFFNDIKVRSVPRQEKPFPPLAKVTQSIFEFTMWKAR